MDPRAQYVHFFDEEAFTETDRPGFRRRVITGDDLQLCFSTSDRIGLLHEGRIVQIAAPEEIRRAPGPEAREFLEGATLPGAPA